MYPINFSYHPSFYTATILEWKHLLKENAFKDIVIDSLRFLAKERSIVVYAFVIIPNHIHLIWQIQDGYSKENIQMRFMKFTAQHIKFRLNDMQSPLLNEFLVDAKGRTYQFWRRDSLSIDLWSEKAFLQKLNYIHQNPIKHPWYLAETPAAYPYSSAKFYETGVDDFGFLSHYRG